MAKIIVSSGDTDNDGDALALGRTLRASWAARSRSPTSPARGAARQRPRGAGREEAEELLEHGAEALRPS